MAMLLAFSNPVEGREDEFNAWYDEVHLPQVVQVPGIVSGRRFELAPGGRNDTRFLAVYDIEGDPREALRELLVRMRSGEIGMSEAIDRNSGGMSIWVSR